MNLRTPSFSRVCFLAVPYLISGAALFIVSDASAQTHGLQYVIRVGVNDNSFIQTQGNTYDSTLVTNNVLTASLGTTTTNVSATVTTTITHTQTQVSASCATFVPPPSYGLLGVFGYATTPSIRAIDTIYANSSSLPINTFVPVVFTLVCSGSIAPTPSVGDAGNGSSSGARAWVSFGGINPEYALYHTYGSNNVTAVYSTTNFIAIGSGSQKIHSCMSFDGAVNSFPNIPQPFVGSVTGNFDNRVYVEALSTNVTLTSASSVIYPKWFATTPALPSPILKIQATGNSASISWPTNYSDYIFQSNTNLATGTWIPATETINIVGTNFQISVIQPTGTKFFRLKK
jgi:hypothetical protein